MAERHVSRPRYLPSAAQGCAKPTQILYVSPVAPGP